MSESLENLCDEFSRIVDPVFRVVRCDRIYATCEVVTEVLPVITRKAYFLFQIVTVNHLIQQLY